MVFDKLIMRVVTKAFISVKFVCGSLVKKLEPENLEFKIAAFLFFIHIVSLDLRSALQILSSKAIRAGSRPD